MYGTPCLDTTIAVTDIQLKIVDIFVYEIGQDERDCTKRQKIDDLALSPVEWEQVKLFNDLLGVRLRKLFILWCH